MAKKHQPKIEDISTKFLSDVADGSAWVNPNDKEVVAAYSFQLISGDMNAKDEDGDVQIDLTEAGKAALASRLKTEDEARAELQGERPILTNEELPSQAHDTAPAETETPKARKYRAKDIDLTALGGEIEEFDASHVIEPKRGAPTKVADRLAEREKAFGMDVMEVGQSRHIRKTEAVPEPHKHYSGMINAHNMQFATQKIGVDGNPELTEKTNRKGEIKRLPVLEFSKKFDIVEVAVTDQRGEGARIVRVK